MNARRCGVRKTGVPLRLVSCPSLLQRRQRACSGPLPGNPAARPTLFLPGALGLGNQHALLAQNSMVSTRNDNPCRRLGRNGGWRSSCSPGINEDDIYEAAKMDGASAKDGAVLLHDHAAANSWGSR